MKKLTATAAIALALASGSAFALNSVDQSSASSVSRIESRDASLAQLIAKNSGSGLPITSADSHVTNTEHGGDRTISLDQLQARNGATGEQTITVGPDSHAVSAHQSHDNTLSKDLLQARNGATGEQTFNADTQRTR